MSALDSYYINTYGPTGLSILKHYYPLSESVGATTAIDSVGGQNGTNTLIVAGVTDIVPTSDGSTCYTFAAGSGVNLGTPFPNGTGSQFAFECWFKFTTVVTKFQSFYQNGIDAHGNNVWQDTSSIEISIDNSSQQTSGFTPSTGAAHHIVAGYDGTNGKIYIDGVQRFSGPMTAGSAPTTSNLLGRWQNTGDGGSFLGQLQKVCYYNQMLTSTQVTNNYNAGNVGPPASGGPFVLNTSGNITANMTGGFQG